MKKKPARLPMQRKAKLPLRTNRPDIAARADEMLTRQVKGMKASDLEERLARALDKKQKPYYFQFVHGAKKGAPGWNSLDFLVLSGRWHAIQVDDTTFIHRGTSGKDALVDAKTITNLRRMGIILDRVEHWTDRQLYDQDAADRTVSIFL